MNIAQMALLVATPNCTAAELFMPISFVLVLTSGDAFVNFMVAVEFA
jgi:hypothetical protein